MMKQPTAVKRSAAIKKALMPYVAKAVSSETVKQLKRAVFACQRILTRQTPTLDVFLRADDPYSYLLAQALVDFSQRFQVQLRYHVVQEIQSEMYPALAMWYDNAVHDARHLAKLYYFHFPENARALSQQAADMLSLALVAQERASDFLDRALPLWAAAWAGETPESTTGTPEHADGRAQQLKANARLLKKKGHYLGAMIAWEGEWYWGVDRLDHLEQRLLDAGMARLPTERVRFDRTYRDFCQYAKPTPSPSGMPALIIYWSARSPYSYLGLERATRLADHYGVELIIKPVLPMMMRGMFVPPVKTMYIFLDTKREARKLGLPYGFVADPLGEAVERCYALVDYARAEGKLRAFLLSFARAVNAEGIRGDTDAGLQRIVERCGLDWQAARQHLGSTDWHTWAQANLDEMFAMGCWGVPSFRFGESHFWGQDRLGILEKAIRARS